MSRIAQKTNDRRGPAVILRGRLLLFMILKIITIWCCFSMTFCPPVYSSVLHVFSNDTIQQVVNMANSNDTVLIHEGNFEESVVLYGKNLVVASEFLLDGDTTHINNTVVTGSPSRQDTSSAIVIAYGESRDTRIVGLTLRGSDGTRDISDPAFRFGGAAFVYVSNPQFDNCKFLGGSAYYGGGLSVRGNWDCSTTGCVLLRCIFLDCNSIGTGGAIWANTCSLSVRQCEFLFDTTEHSCSGVRVVQSCILIDSSRFEHCYGGTGGALLIANCNGMVSRCEFVGNGAHGQGGITDLSFSNSGTSINGSYFGSNSTPNVSIIWQANSLSARFSGNVFENMTATLLSGTFAVSEGPGDVSYNVFRQNTNIGGGAVHGLQNARARVHHNYFTDNISLNPERGSAVTTFSTLLRLDSNHFTANNGTTVSANNDFALWNVTNNYWGDPSGPYHPTQNPTGQGDTLLSDSVLFIPWLTEPPDTTFVGIDERATRPELTHTWQLMELYPNPFNSTITVDIAGFTRADFSLRVFDVLGREQAVLQRGALAGGRMSFSAPPELSSGIYFIVASDHTHRETRKAILIR